MDADGVSLDSSHSSTRRRRRVGGCLGPPAMPTLTSRRARPWCDTPCSSGLLKHGAVCGGTERDKPGSSGTTGVVTRRTSPPLWATLSPLSLLRLPG